MTRRFVMSFVSSLLAAFVLAAAWSAGNGERARHQVLDHSNSQPSHAEGSL